MTDDIFSALENATTTAPIEDDRLPRLEGRRRLEVDTVAAIAATVVGVVCVLVSAVGLIALFVAPLGATAVILCAVASAAVATLLLGGGVWVWTAERRFRSGP